MYKGPSWRRPFRPSPAPGSEAAQGRSKAQPSAPAGACQAREGASRRSWARRCRCISTRTAAPRRRRSVLTLPVKCRQRSADIAALSTWITRVLCRVRGLLATEARWHDWSDRSIGPEPPMLIHSYMSFLYKNELKNPDILGRPCALLYRNHRHPSPTHRR